MFILMFPNMALHFDKDQSRTAQWPFSICFPRCNQTSVQLELILTPMAFVGQCVELI